MTHRENPPAIRHVDVLGVQVSAVNMEQSVEMLLEAVRCKTPRYVCVTGVHGVMEAQRDRELLDSFNSAYLSVPDGMPLSWLGWLRGHCTMDRVFGPDLMAALCERTAQGGVRHFLYGGKLGVAEELSERLRERFPGLNIVGTYTPPFGPLNASEEAELAALVLRAEPHVIWVGISTPRQEMFMARYKDIFNVPLMVGVGAAFDYHTGRVKDCAPWIKRAGLQWLHRLLQDPRRLAGRYLRMIPLFIVRSGSQWMYERFNRRGTSLPATEQNRSAEAQS